MRTEKNVFMYTIWKKKNRERNIEEASDGVCVSITDALVEL